MKRELPTLENMLQEHIISQRFYDWLIANGFKAAPASATHHGNFSGGLYAHSQAVTSRLLLFDSVRHEEHAWERVQSPYIVGMFHDLCKIDQYQQNHIDEHNTNAWSYNENTLLKGHGDKSIMLLSQFIMLTEEEMLCIRYHMGAYETKDWDEYGRAIEKYPNVLYTHAADMLASRLNI